MYDQLKSKIDQYIRTNGVRAITGAILNEVLNDMVDGLGTNAGFGGSITPSSQAPTTENNIFFIASTAGTYTNFSGIVVASNELAFIRRQGNGWVKDSWMISIPDVSGKADKVIGATSGNFASLDGNGNLTDSDSKASDFATPSDIATSLENYRPKFVCNYGVTTYSDIIAAYNSGKIVLVEQSGRISELNRVRDTVCYFFRVETNNTNHIVIYKITVTSNNEWSNENVVLEKTTDKVSTIEGYESDTTKYPNTKAVYDYVTDICGDIQTILTSI